jgi:hypothetical protein
MFVQPTWHNDRGRHGGAHSAGKPDRGDGWRGPSSRRADEYWAANSCADFGTAMRAMILVAMKE